MNPMSLLSHIKENWPYIWKGTDFRIALVITVMFIVCTIPAVFSIQCGDIDFDIQLVFVLIDSLFSVLIGAFATIIAFVFAGLIFLVSFHYDDKFTPLFAYKDGKTYSMFSFNIRWLAALGCFGIITSVCTIILKCFGYTYLTLIFCILSLFLFIYVITSTISLFSLLTVYGKLRLDFFEEIRKRKSSRASIETKNEDEKQ